MTQIPSDIVFFESEPEQRELLALTVDYLRKNPPTLGHGFSHFIKTARQGYSLALLNDPTLVKLAWISGLLHDIYRPAEGKGGQEDHDIQAAKIAGEILLQSPYKSQAEQIVGSLRDHDKAIIEGRANLLARIISIADKAEMCFTRWLAYTWASNKALSAPIYSSFIEIMRDNSAYQVKAWKIFSTISLKGTNLAIYAFLKTDEDIINAVRAEVRGAIKFKDEHLRLAKAEVQLEKQMMEEFKLSPEEITDISKNFLELF